MLASLRLILISSLGLLASIASADPTVNDVSARQRLDLMTNAVRTTNYRGTFVYTHGNKLESMKIFHRYDNQSEQERLVSLTGESQEIVRNDQRVVYYMPGEKKALVDKSQRRTPYQAATPKNLDQLSKYYEFINLGKERVAGRDCFIIAMKPRDMMRYGYRLWLDSETHLLLKADVVDISSRILEQMMFTAVEYPEQISVAEVTSPLSDAGFAVTHAHEQRENESQLGVRVRGVAPNGFALSGRRAQAEVDSDEQSQHIIFTDGMASISIFVARLKPGMPPMQGATRMGAINAHGKVVGQHQITVVGDVPAPTVKLVSNSVTLTKR